eukprot:678882-Rhodomonas_salina.9
MGICGVRCWSVLGLLGIDTRVCRFPVTDVETAQQYLRELKQDMWIDKATQVSHPPPDANAGIHRFGTVCTTSAAALPVVDLAEFVRRQTAHQRSGATRLSRHAVVPVVPHRFHGHEPRGSTHPWTTC